METMNNIGTDAIEVVKSNSKVVWITAATTAGVCVLAVVGKKVYEAAKDKIKTNKAKKTEAGEAEETKVETEE